MTNLSTKLSFVSRPFFVNQRNQQHSIQEALHIVPLDCLLNQKQQIQTLSPPYWVYIYQRNQHRL